MMDSGKINKEMDKEDKFILTVLYMKDIGRMIKDMEKEDS